MIARKPPKLLAMIQLVDNDYARRSWIEMGWPCAGLRRLGARLDRRVGDERLQACTTGRSPGEAWLRYQHVPPNG